MNEKQDVNRAFNLLIKPNTITSFLNKLNANEFKKFRESSNITTALKNWLRTRHGQNAVNGFNMLTGTIPTTFNRYVNTLEKTKSNNMNLVKKMTPKRPPPFVQLEIGNKGYIQIEPVCPYNFNKGVYIAYGYTNKPYRNQKIGTRLRTIAVKAARNSKIPLYQVSQNIEGLVEKGKMPYSGKIMEKLGASRINHAPPCRAKNKRGNYNYAYVVGNVKHFKKPTTARPSKLKKRLE